MRALRLQWSWAFSLVCEVTLRKEAYMASIKETIRKFMSSFGIKENLKSRREQNTKGFVYMQIATSKANNMSTSSAMGIYSNNIFYCNTCSTHIVHVVVHIYCIKCHIVFYVIVVTYLVTLLMDEFTNIVIPQLTFSSSTFGIICMLTLTTCNELVSWMIEI